MSVPTTESGPEQEADDATIPTDIAHPIRSVNELLEHIFTTTNPETGTTPPDVAWVIYAHGTVFYTGIKEVLPAKASFEMLADAARSAFAELGPVVAGGPEA